MVIDVVVSVGTFDHTASSFATIDCEAAVFWRSLVEFYKMQKDSDKIEQLLPSVSDLAARIQDFINKLVCAPFERT